MSGPVLYKVIVHRKSGKTEGCNGDEEMLRTRYKESKLRKEEGHQYKSELQMTHDLSVA